MEYTDLETVCLEVSKIVTYYCSNITVLYRLPYFFPHPSFPPFFLAILIVLLSASTFLDPFTLYYSLLLSICFALTTISALSYTTLPICPWLSPISSPHIFPNFHVPPPNSVIPPPQLRWKRAEVCGGTVRTATPHLCHSWLALSPLL